jgi:indolepyruvate ferredoxin oxidoreductase
MSALLADAASRDGYRVQWVDQKGLAQRNGAVTSFISWVSEEKSEVAQTTVALSAHANLILGVDLLESARSAKYLDPKHTNAVVNTAKTPTTTMIMGEEIFPEGVDRQVSELVQGCVSDDFTALSLKYFGNRVFANTMMLGAAFQKGWIPVSAVSLEAALLEQTKSRDPELNQKAWNLGRAVALGLEKQATASGGAHVSPAWRKEASDYVKWSWGWGWGSVVTQRFLQSLDQWQAEISDPKLYYTLAVRLRDLFARDGSADALEKLLKGRLGFSASKLQAVIEIIGYVCLIKDEVWVANLLVSPLKLESDRRRYNLGPRDKIYYRHLNRPHFDLGPWKLEWDMETRNWMLHLMRHLRMLRRLLPGWHLKERAWRDYVLHQVVPKLWEASEQTVAQVRDLILNANGYREIRYPKIEKAKIEIDRLLHQNRKAG